MSQNKQIRIISSKTASAEKEDRQACIVGGKTQNFKYENYFDLNILLSNVAPHQVMALNRGEKQKVLKVKIQIPEGVKKTITSFIWNTFFNRKHMDKATYDFLQICVSDAYDRLIEPHVCRQIRSDLSKHAEKESIAVFCSNLKSLLLTPPVRGKTVVGVDPGFTHGCKIAAVSSKGAVLATDVIYPHSKSRSCYASDAETLKSMLTTYGLALFVFQVLCMNCKKKVVK
ncbi:uncharacterized protein YdcI-like [Stegodyphus dumicola]|uniref:uncharacterized protein YdcI-like n=1 Tax=Stegodyphus dumicola TaxID=202533 RepID=UPI0015A78842|nr:uncharacterized protein YdcI-like [Stegodyphus dumicola]